MKILGENLLPTGSNKYGEILYKLDKPGWRDIEKGKKTLKDWKKYLGYWHLII